MSLQVEAHNTTSTADAAAGMMLPQTSKRTVEDQNDGAPKAKRFQTDAPCQTQDPATIPMRTPYKEQNSEDVPAKRKIRLEQNRRAAKVSRERKKNMIGELQRSVIFFTRANASLKSQNDELSRLLIEAQACINRADEGGNTKVKAEDSQLEDSTGTVKNDARQKDTIAAKDEDGAKAKQAEPEDPSDSDVQKESCDSDVKKEPGDNHVKKDPNASNIKKESKPAIAQPPPSTTTAAVPDLNAVETGSSMQAMASFQQAASLAMKDAMKGLQGTGLNMSQLAAGPSYPAFGGVNSQQAFTDTMTAIAMQQAAAQHAFMMSAFPMTGFPFMMNPMFALQMQQQQQLQQQFLLPGSLTQPQQLRPHPYQMMQYGQQNAPASSPPTTSPPFLLPKKAKR